MAGERHIVWQNEEISPFNHECTNYSTKKGLYAFSTFMYFAEPTIGPLIVTFVAEEYKGAGKLLALTPFKPDMGYPLGVEDFTSEKRKQKLAYLARNKRTKIVKGIIIYAVVQDESIEKSGYLWTHPDPSTWILREEARRIFHHAFLVITLPNGGSFASLALWKDNLPAFIFHRFFPTDTGPLPEIEIPDRDKHPLSVNYGDEGFALLLPQNRELLEAMKAKFLLLPDVNESNI